MKEGQGKIKQEKEKERSSGTQPPARPPQNTGFQNQCFENQISTPGFGNQCFQNSSIPLVSETSVLGTSLIPLVSETSVCDTSIVPLDLKPKCSCDSVMIWFLKTIRKHVHY